MKQVKAPVLSNTEVAPGVHLIWLKCPEIAREAKPGQFVMVRCGENVLPRPFGIHQRNGDKLALLFVRVGKGTDFLSRKQAHAAIDIFGPLGNGFSINPSSKNLLLVPGGIGIGPLAFLAEEAANRGCAVKLHQGANQDGQVLLKPLRSHHTLVPRLPASASQGDSSGTIECTASTATPSAFFPTGLAMTYCVQEGLAARADQIIACGPLPMYKAMSQMPELKGKSVQISLELRMGCGFGVCYGCTIHTRNGLKQVCKDGPVFNLDDITNWDELVL